MRIASGDKVDGKVVVTVSLACQYAGCLFRSAHFDDGTYGIIYIENGVAKITYFDDADLKRALLDSQEMPTLEVDENGKGLWVKGRDSEGIFAVLFVPAEATS